MKTLSIFLVSFLISFNCLYAQLSVQLTTDKPYYFSGESLMYQVIILQDGKQLFIIAFLLGQDQGLIITIIG